MCNWAGAETGNRASKQRGFEVSEDRSGRIGVQLHLVSIAEAALLMGRSLRTLRYWQSKGMMPDRIRIGRQKLYRADQLPLTEENKP